MKTVADAIRRVRDNIQDSPLPYRYSNDSMVPYADDAQQEVWRRRPDSTMWTTILTDPPATIATATQQFQVDDRYLTAIAAYMSACILRQDSDNTVNDSRAQYWMSEFERLVVL